jgi:hypothetical protein
MQHFVSLHAGHCTQVKVTIATFGVVSFRNMIFFVLFQIQFGLSLVGTLGARKNDDSRLGFFVLRMKDFVLRHVSVRPSVKVTVATFLIAYFESVMNIVLG